MFLTADGPIMDRHGVDSGSPLPDAEPAANTGYSLSVTPSIDTPDSSVTIGGTDFQVTRTGRVQPGHEFTVDVTAPEKDYNVEVRDQDEAVNRLRYNEHDDSTVIFDSGSTDSKDALVSRSYGVAAVVSSQVQAFHPLVVSGYSVSVMAPAVAEVNAGIDVEADITKLQSERDIPPIDRLEAFVWQNDDEKRSEMAPVGGSTYETNVTRPAGDYTLAVVVFGQIESDSGPLDEPMGFSDPQPVSVVDGSSTLSPAWTGAASGRMQYSRPAVDADRTYVGGLGQTVDAYDRASGGDRSWSHTRAGALSDSGPVLADDAVYVGSGGGVLYALDTDPGVSDADRVIWKEHLGSAITATPVVANGSVYVGTNDGRVVARDAESGGPRWTVDVGGPIYSALDASADRVFATTADGDVTALATADGSEDWRRTTGTDLGASAPVYSEGSIYVAGESVLALDAVAGDTTVQWQFGEFPGGFWSTAAVDGGSVFVGSADGILYALDDAGGGAVQWSVGIGPRIASQPAVTTDRVVVGALDGTVVVVDRATGEWLDAGSVGAPVRSPIVVHGDDAFVGSRAGEVAVFTGIP
jgi:outer membrane protein assembly factor BamB